MKTRFHEYLTQFRKLKGYTQARMAEDLGIPRSTYTNYETGNRTPDLDTLERISDTLDCSLDELFGRKPVPFDTICETPISYKAEVRQPDHKKVKKLVIGLQDFRHFREKNGYYVDKTQMIEEFLESGYQITLLTRPRRFGKTLNMSMLAEFLDCTKKSADIFKGTKINDSPVVQEMNKHPVIFISFLNVKGDTAEDMLYQLAYVLEREYDKYHLLFNGGRLSEKQRKKYDDIYQGLCQPDDIKQIGKYIKNAVTVLCEALEAYYGKKVYLLIDEYDTPFIAANAGGYYDEMRGVLAGMLSTSLKGNPALEKAMLTGIQRVAKENIFSGLNNLIVCTVCDSEYSDCFGFTEEETTELLRYYGLELSEDIKAMYDGYLIGETEVYNPWSVVCYTTKKELKPYWVNTSENSVIKHALEQRGEKFSRAYNKLIEKGTVNVNVELTTAYYEQPDDASLWGLLLNAGMVTIQEKVEEGFYTLRIPNYEVRKAFQDLTAFYLKVEEGHISSMLRYLRLGMMEEFAEEYRWILLEIPSYHDLKGENSYHMMMLGACAFLFKDYEVRSNRESGTGRSDILLYAKKPGKPHMILEFKYTKDESQNLEELAEDAIKQIKEKKYDAGMSGPVCYIGLAHFGKSAAVRWDSSGFEKN